MESNSMSSGVARSGFTSPIKGHVFTHDKYPHLDENEWAAVVRMQDHVGIFLVANLLQQDEPTQKTTIHAFMNLFLEQHNVMSLCHNERCF